MTFDPIEYYGDRAASDGPAHAVNGWGSAESMRERYRMLTLGVSDKLSRPSVLDVGCGTAEAAALYSHYTGIDICQAMIDRSRAPERVFLASIHDVPADASYDCVITSGSLTLEVGDNESRAVSCLSAMYAHAAKMVAWNFMHARCGYEMPQNHHYSREFMLEFAETLGGTVVAIESTALPWEMTIQVWRPRP